MFPTAVRKTLVTLGSDCEKTMNERKYGLQFSRSHCEKSLWYCQILFCVSLGLAPGYSSRNAPLDAGAASQGLNITLIAQIRV
jgi:hypothetical protein